MTLHGEDPGKRAAQHRLAIEVLEFVHGAEIALKTQDAHCRLRAPTLATLGVASDHAKIANASTDDVLTNKEDTDSAASRRILLARTLFENKPLETILFNAGLIDNKASARRLIQGGGLYVASVVRSESTTNDISAKASSDTDVGGELVFRPMKNPRPLDIQKMMENGSLLIIRMGKWKVRIIEVVDDDVYERNWRSGAVDAPQEWLLKMDEHQSKGDA